MPDLELQIEQLTATATARREALRKTATIVLADRKLRVLLLFLADYIKSHFGCRNQNLSTASILLIAM